MTDLIFKSTGMKKDFWITPQNAQLYADRGSMFIREYLSRAKSDGVVIGMSGGLDSAVAGALCARAEVKVHAAILPYGDSMGKSGSGRRALEIIDKFHWNLSLDDIRLACYHLSSSDRHTPAHLAKLANINLQARIRTAKLREIAQRENYLLLGTDNLTELMLGYFTKDGNGSDFRPLALMLKRELYTIAPIIGVPQSIIDAVPSAELFLNQTDESELGFTYNQADDFIQYETCGNPEIDQKILSTIQNTQHKRTPPMTFTG